MFKKKRHEVYILVLTRGEASGDPEAREKECKAAAETIGADRLFFGDLRDARITDGIETIKVIENTIDTVAPDIVFSHSPKDAHQDHRNTHLASLSAARRIRKIFLYESPAALREFCPQLFVDIAETIDLKLKALTAFNSQASKPYLNGRVYNAIAGLAKFRGFQAGVAVAEAFEVARCILEVQEF